MKKIFIFVCATAIVASANTYVAGRGIPACSSSPNLILTIMDSGKVAGGVRVDVYRVIPNGERVSWSGLTGPDGVAKPSALTSGTYRIFAGQGEHSGNMRLIVGEFEGTPTTCTLKLQSSAAIMSTTEPEEEPNYLALKQFSGMVVDGTNMPMPRVIVRVFRLGLTNYLSDNYLWEFQADSKGQFIRLLEKGDYMATFDYQGFKTRTVAFHLGSDGWPGFQVSLTPEHDPPATEWEGDR